MAEQQQAFLDGPALRDFALERFTPGTFGPKTAYEHWSRYLFALSYVRDREVLDYGCGTGFGSRLLAESARDVLALDRASDAIRYAEEHHPHPRCQYAICDDLPTDAATASRDVVVCFEVIEHLHHQRELLRELRRILRPDGVLLVSTPEPSYTAGLGENPYHVRELPRDEFVALVAEHFPHHQVFVQSPLVGEALCPENPAEATPATLRVLTFDAAQNAWNPVAALPGPSQTYLVVASAALLPPSAACVISDRDGRFVADLEAYVARLERERAELTAILEAERQEAAQRSEPLRREAEALAARDQALRDLAALRDQYAAAMADLEARAAANEKTLAECREAAAVHAREAEAARRALVQAEHDVRRLRNDVVYLEGKVGLRYVAWAARGAAQSLGRLSHVRTRAK